MKKVVFGLVLAFSMLGLAKSVYAVDGEVDLINRIGGNAVCWAPGVLIQNTTYKILFSCRNLTYPGGTQVFNYVAWLNPTAGGAAQRLGTLGVGKAEFQTNTEYSSLFVTTERDPNTRTPQGPVVMSGFIQTRDVLEKGTKGTGSTPITSASPEVSPVPTPAPSTGIAKFLTGGILAILGIAGIIFLLFVITKK